MSKRLRYICFLLLPLLAVVGLGGAVAGGALTRAKLRSAELAGNTRFQTMLNDDPASLLGDTRAIYLQGYGLVLSAEIDVAPRYTPNPFRPAFTKEEIARIHQIKRDRLIALREQMRKMLITYAGEFDLPASENIALAITIPYSKVEDSEGLPKQIVMSAPGTALRSKNDMTIISSLKVQEFF